MYTFYHAPGSSSLAVHIALNEVGAEFASRTIMLNDRDQDPAEFRALNPEGKVPTLVIDGRPLTEVAAILYYLARRYPEASLFPSGDLEAEAHVISWMSFTAATLHPARRAGLDHARTVYHLAEQRLGTNTWAAEAYSIADIHLFRLFWRFRGSLGVDPAVFPNLSAHLDRMMERPAVRKTFAAEAALGIPATGVTLPGLRNTCRRRIAGCAPAYWLPRVASGALPLCRKTLATRKPCRFRSTGGLHDDWHVPSSGGSGQTPGGK